MTEPTLTDVYERLGGLKATLDAVRDDIAESRDIGGKLAAKVETIADRTARLEQIVEKLEPAVDSLSTLRAKALGGVAVILFVGGVAGYVAGFWLTELKIWIARIIFGH